MHMRRLVQCSLIALVTAATVAAPNAHANPSATQPATTQSLNPIIDSLDLRNSTLEKAIDALREKSKVNIVVRWHELEAVGIDKATPVELRVGKLPLQRLLELLGEAAGLHHPIGAQEEDSVVIVSTKDDLQAKGTLRMYDVRDLIEADMATTLEMPPRKSVTTAPVTPSPEERFAMSLQRLKYLIMESIEPESWREAGGTVGSVHHFNGQLIIAQRPVMHERIKKLLDDLRRPK